MSKHSELFATELTKLSRAITLLGGHSRLLLLNRNRDVLINDVITCATNLREYAQAHDAQNHALAVVKEQTPVQIQSDGIEKDAIDTQSKGITSQSQEPGLNAAFLALPELPETALGQPFVLASEGIKLHNPHNQRVVFKSSDESVLEFVDDSKLEPIIHSFGQALITATLYKKGDIAGSKHELDVVLFKGAADNAQEQGDALNYHIDTSDNIAPEGSEPIGFVLPEPDYDLELSLGTDAYIGSLFELPIEVANPTEHVAEFESSDESVFEVDTQTGAILPKGEGDAMLVVHLGEVKDELFVSIKA